MFFLLLFYYRFYYIQKLSLFLKEFKKKYSLYRKFIIFCNLFKITFYPVANRIILKLDNDTKDIYDASLAIQSKYEFFTKNKISKIKMIDKKLLLSNYFRKIGIYNIVLTVLRALKISI